MINVNEKKHQALILGKTEHNFCFPVNNPIDIFGMAIDNRLSFDNHVSVIFKKINNQFNIMLRFRKLINKEMLLKLYKAFILLHFYYCSSVWHFCSARNADKVDNLNKRILRFILPGPVVRTPVRANPGLNFNPGFFFFLSKALFRIIFYIIFRVSNYQIVGKEN